MKLILNEEQKALSDRAQEWYSVTAAHDTLYYDTKKYLKFWNDQTEFWYDITPPSVTAILYVLSEYEKACPSAHEDVAAFSGVLESFCARAGI